MPRTNKGDNVLVSGVDDAFHVYSAVWSPEQIRMSVDGRSNETNPRPPHLV